jgi:hypothetical protein
MSIAMVVATPSAYFEEWTTCGRGETQRFADYLGERCFLFVSADVKERYFCCGVSITALDLVERLIKGCKEIDADVLSADVYVPTNAGQVVAEKYVDDVNRALGLRIADTDRLLRMMDIVERERHVVVDGNPVYERLITTLIGDHREAIRQARLHKVPVFLNY